MNPVRIWVRRLAAAAVVVPVLVLGLAGCYPGEAPVSDIVATLHDTDNDFTTYATFTLPDSVVDAGDPDDPGYIEVSHEYDDAVLARIRSNLVALGWTEIPEDSITSTRVPDVVIMVTALISETTNIWYYPPYWGWWGGWYGGWWGYYPGWGYPCCYDVTTYTTGTIGIDMAAMKDVDPDTETAPIAWAARLNGLVNKTNATQARIEKAIDQAFSQSPYLDID